MKGAQKYAEAVRLYAETSMSLTDIARELGLSRTAFAAYIQRNHRDLMFRRHGVEVGHTEDVAHTEVQRYRGVEVTEDVAHTEVQRYRGVEVTEDVAHTEVRRYRGVEVTEDVAHTELDGTGRLRGQTGQGRVTHEKYREAVLACDSEEYIKFTVADIARMFGVSPAALSNQLRVHFPEVVERRNMERELLGLGQRRKSGASKVIKEQYAEAVDMVRRGGMTLKEVADKCGVSFTGLRQHIQFYHRDLLKRK